MLRKIEKIGQREIPAAAGPEPKSGDQGEAGASESPGIQRKALSAMWQPDEKNIKLLPHDLAMYESAGVHIPRKSW